MLTPIIAALIGVVSSVIIFMLTTILKKLGDVDNKLFTHLTNDSMHPVRDHLVTQAEFELHRRFYEATMKEIKEELRRLHN